MPSKTENATGGCPCGLIRYRLLANPLFTHCCFCTWCQKESGSAFAVNLIIETEAIQFLPPRRNELQTWNDHSSKQKVSLDDREQNLTNISIPSDSGSGQVFWRCASCHVALWSHYIGATPGLRFVRSGTLDDASTIVEPDVYIYASTKPSWVRVPEGAKVFEESYDRKKEWSVECSERLERLKAEGLKEK